uniref:Laminin G domain-containing protein n=1 Tax=Romanomermis culicivorax TaxID=13658 RepID=A0A915L130_ROMCU
MEEIQNTVVNKKLDPMYQRYSTRRVQKVARHIRELNFINESFCQDQSMNAVSVDSDVHYLKLNKSYSKNTEPVIFSFAIKTKVDRAIIFYEKSSALIPFILALEDSKIAFIFTDSNGTTRISKSDISISDGKWHTVLMERIAGLCTIIIDNDKSKIYTSNFKGVLSVTDYFIYFGKTSTVAFKKFGVLQNSSFVGCLRDIRFKGSLVNLHSVSSNLTACRQ